MQSGVTTFLLGFKNHPQNVPLLTPKLHNGAIFQLSRNLTGMFLLYSVEGREGRRAARLGESSMESRRRSERSLSMHGRRSGDQNLPRM